MEVTYILIIGFILLSGFLIYVAIMTNEKKCPPNEVMYVNRPRTFTEEQKDYPKVSEIFSNLFTDPSTYVGGSRFSELELQKTE